MNFQNVQNAYCQKNNRIIHEGADDKKAEYIAIRGGLSLPVILRVKGGMSPFYFICIGQLWDERSRYEGYKEQMGKLVVLCEDVFEEHLNQNRFFKALTDAARRFWCDEFYTNIEGDDPQEDPPSITAFKRFISENKVTPYTTIKQAPFAEDFHFRVALIRRYLSEGRVTIPDGSILKNQLRSITDDDWTNDSLFHAINACGYVLASFWKSPPSTGGHWSPPRKIRSRR